MSTVSLSLGVACGDESFAELSDRDASATAVVFRPTLPGFDLRLEVQGNDLSIEWDEVGSTSYEVWRSSDPYFRPGDPGSMVLASTDAVTLLDPGVICIGCEDRYYIVQTSQGEQSTTVGAHHVMVFDGYNKMPLSLVMPALTHASDLVPVAQEGLLGGYRWSPEAQEFVGWLPSWDTDGFALTLGEAPVVHLSLPPGPQVRVLSGHVPAPGAQLSLLQPGDNIVTLPLTHPDLWASQLHQAVPEASRVGRWDPAIQQIQWYAGPGDDDYIVTSGHDLHLEVDVARTWPIPVPPIYREGFEEPEGASWPSPWETSGDQVLSATVVAQSARFNANPSHVGRMVLPGFSESNVDVSFTVVLEEFYAQGLGFYARQNGGALRQTEVWGQGYGVYVEGGFFQYLGIWREVEGIEEILFGVPVPGAELLDDQPYRIRFQCFTEGSGTRLRTRLWPANDEEPDEWAIDIIDDTPQLQGVGGSFAADVYNYAGSGSVAIDDIIIQRVIG